MTSIGSLIMFRRLATAALLSIALAAPGFVADVKTHRVAIQVNQNDPQVMNLALNNATNVIEYYRGKNEEVEVDIVTYGPRPAHASIRHLAGAGPPETAEGAGISQQNSVFRLQQYAAGHGEDRRQGNPGR